MYLAVRKKPQDFPPPENQHEEEHSSVQTVCLGHRRHVIKTIKLQHWLKVITLNSTQDNHTHALGSSFGLLDCL